MIHLYKPPWAQGGFLSSKIVIKHHTCAHYIYKHINNYAIRKHNREEFAEGSSGRF